VAALTVGDGDDIGDAEIDQRLDLLSWLLDDLFRIPGLGWRFGLDALIGLVPGIGDVVTTAASLYVLAAAVRYRVPKVTVLRMGLNLLIDFALGSLPVVGDVFDAWWKANSRNLALLRRSTTVSPPEVRRGSIGDWLFVGLVGLLLLTVAVGAAAMGIYVVTTVARGVWGLLGG
jgi:hypothetical protein